MNELENRDIAFSVEEIMHTAYLQYSLSVNVGRAIPDVRDGLKPVNRRILYAMKQQGFTHNQKTVLGAGSLLGVTMQESGVSKIISMRLDEDIESIKKNYEEYFNSAPQEKPQPTFSESTKGSMPKGEGESFGSYWGYKKG